MCTSRTSKPARLRFRPPGPSAERRRSCVSWLSGLVWSTTWRQLAPAEEVFDAGRDTLGVDQFGQSGQFVGILDGHAFLDGAAEFEEALAEFLGRQFVDGPQAAVAQVVDVVEVDLGIVGTQPQDVLEGVDEVERLEAHHASVDFLVELAVHAEPADPAQAVAVIVAEFLVEEFSGLVELRRVARRRRV